MKLLKETMELITTDHIIYGICLFMITMVIGNFFKKRHDGNLNNFFEKIILGGGMGLIKAIVIAVIIVLMVFVVDTKQKTEDMIVLVFYYLFAILSGFAIGAIYRWRIQKEHGL